ncbi:FLT1 [Mytilus edulis]|uniref:FLT1 n=1 Tax=Mytilus edulis TaxID=6550 RepID=A0A8S3PZ76_MYTED|nr:FLT1 [Mytilus edulis]
MEQTVSHSIDENKLNEDIDRDKSPYINKTQWCEENSSAVELQLLRVKVDTAIDNSLPYVMVRASYGNATYNWNKSDDYVIPTGQSFTIDCHGSYPPRLRILRRNRKNEEPNFVSLNITKVELSENQTVRNFGAFYHVFNPDFTYTGEYELKIGEEFEIQCRTYIDRGAAVFMNWSYSSNENSSNSIELERSDRVHYTDPLREVSSGTYDFDVLYSNLTVIKVKKSDEGVYICKVVTDDGKSDNVSTVINVIGRTKTRVTAFTIRKVIKQMSGTYTVTAQNTLTSSKDIELIVKYKPLVQIKSTKLRNYFILNRLYTITCNTDSVPPVDFGDIWMEFSPFGIDFRHDNFRRQWKNLSDSNLKVDYEAQKGSGFKLMLYASRTGVFRCKAKNEIGSTTSANEKVKIIGSVKPHLVEGQLNQNTIININKGISYKVADCEMIGTPEPKFKWFKDNKLIEYTNNFGIYFTNNNKSLHINKTSKIHEGVYTCEATNRRGVAYMNWTLVVGMVLGQGHFGRVIKAEAIGILENKNCSTVAVKTPKGELMVIIEYCHFGNLRNYLIQKKETFKDPKDNKLPDNLINGPLEDANGPLLSTNNLISWAFQVARGMEYLTSKKGPVPVKWIAIESLTHQIYTTKSDVYKVMKATWQIEPDERPTFTKLACLMGDLLESNVKQYYLNLYTSNYLKMVDAEKSEDESTKGAYGYNGFLKMSGEPSDYTKMEQAPSHPIDQNMLNEDIDRDKSPYINKKHSCEENSSAVELQPLREKEDSDNDTSSRFTKMEQAPSHSIDQDKLNEEIDRDKCPYINKRQLCEENSSAVELQPLKVNEDSDNDISREGNKREKPHQYINTSSYCQRNDHTLIEVSNAPVPVSAQISDNKAGPEDEM